MPKTVIGYARCSTDKQDLTAQRDVLVELGVAANRIYVDHGLTGKNRARPGLNQARSPVSVRAILWSCQIWIGSPAQYLMPGPSQMNWQHEA
ncbi:recombinase family protein [Acidisarcina polymorpha]|uniref:recombinase family protein n=1 Tax=Acidisarcina polymorpha TaxID=2211140 RepID=UPI0026A3120A